LAVFLCASIVLGIIKSAIGFYVVFGIFLVGYFGERILKLWKIKLKD